MEKNLLITGASGLLGQYLNIQTQNLYNTLSVYNSNIGNCNDFNSVKADITNVDQVTIIFRDFKPDYVIHAAAITNPVIKKNQSPKDYFRTNVRATEMIASLCKAFGSKLIYISTDLVYAGYRGSILKEDSKLIPASLYAETKLMGEVKVMEQLNNYLILRVALLFGIALNHSSCHFQQMINSLKSDTPVKLFTDQFRTPISLRETSRIITELINNTKATGIVNLGGTERVSRFELGEILCRVAGFDNSLLIKTSMDEIPGIPKVEDVSMNTDKLNSLGIKQKSIEESIVEIIN